MNDLLVFYADAPFGCLDVCTHVKVENLDDAMVKLSLYGGNGYKIKSAYHRTNKDGNSYSCRIKIPN